MRRAALLTSSEASRATLAATTRRGPPDAGLDGEEARQPRPQPEDLSRPPGSGEAAAQPVDPSEVGDGRGHDLDPGVGVRGLGGDPMLVAKRGSHPRG